MYSAQLTLFIAMLKTMNAQDLSFNCSFSVYIHDLKEMLLAVQYAKESGYPLKIQIKADKITIVKVWDV